MRLVPGGRGLAALLLAATALGGCSQPAASPSVELTIYAASSLAEALDQIRTVYARVRPGVALTISTDSSAALAAKIEQGAAADVFLSADATEPETLQAAGLVAGEPVAFAGNKLTVIVPSGNPAFINSAADLGRPGVKVVAAGDEVPITGYAARLLRNLARLPAFPADLPRLYSVNVVTRVDSVAAIVSQIELGEGDAAIVYSTDATSGKVLRIEVPDSANIPVIYVGVVMRASRSVTEAQAFLDWLTSDDGRSVLGNFGFVAPSR
jgi:molybdate transport system substrate-binding protein